MKCVDELESMELHQELEVGEELAILKVKGGWIYKHYVLKYNDETNKEYYELKCTTFVRQLK